MNLLEWLQTARIDIKSQGEGNNVKVKAVKGEHCNIITAPWFSECGEGYTLETKDKHLILEIECVGDGELLLALHGIDRQAPSGERLPLWVDYTRMAVNDELVFWEIKPLWHDIIYWYRKQVSDGEKVQVEISWYDHAYRGEELANLLSLWSTLPKN